jgi:hypothetical protein
MVKKLLAKQSVKVAEGQVTGAQQQGSVWTVTLDNSKNLTADLSISSAGVVPNQSFISEGILDSKGCCPSTHSFTSKLPAMGISHRPVDPYG